MVYRRRSYRRRRAPRRVTTRRTVVVRKTVRRKRRMGPVPMIRTALNKIASSAKRKAQTDAIKGQIAALTGASMPNAQTIQEQIRTNYTTLPALTAGRQGV